MRRHLFIAGFLLAGLPASLAAAAGGDGAVRSFSTGGHTVYHVRTGSVDGKERVVVTAAIDGHVLCHRADGTLLWKRRIDGAFPFDLAVADIDADGRDETLAATASGTLYAIDERGRMLWTFTTPAPLFQVCTARAGDGAALILTGGVEHTLYALSPAGRKVGSLPTRHVVRHLRSGKNGDLVAMATTNRGLSGNLSLWMIDPDGLTVRWKKSKLGSHAHNSGRRFFSMVIVDLNRDGRNDVLLSDSWGEHGRIFGFDHAGNALYDTNDRKIPNVSYRMNLLDHVTLPDDEYIMGHFGNILILYNLDGTCREVVRGPYSFADGAFDPATRTYYLGSAVSGGDGMYALRLDTPAWKAAYRDLEPTGKLAAILDNIETLTRQVAAFRPPPYQGPPRNVTVLSREPKGARYKHLTFIRGKTLSQAYADRKELWCRRIDRRRRYDLTAKQIVAAAARLEKAGRPFVVWAGHGHAVHMPLSTFRAVIEAAPKNLRGFAFAEMEGVDDHMGQVVEKILLPLAKLCRKRGTKIIFRNKNIFWNGTCYVPCWRRVLLDARFRDVFVPALEETNCRTAELSLAGRIGLWLTGAFDRWSCRMVTDNANFDRMWEWAGQQVLSHHLRHLVSRAAHGADVFFNSIHQGPFSRALYRQLVPFYDLLEKGIVHIPARDRLLSVSDTCLGMRSPPSPAFIRHGTNGHRYRYPDDAHPPMVFDRLDCYWAGAPLAAHDFSGLAFGVPRRMCNYLPVTPFGMVPIVPDDADLSGTRLHTKISTDGRHYYDAAGKPVEPGAYREEVERLLTAAAGRLPLLVSGPAHWAAARLDAAHVRVTLIDPGYLDPADREVTVVLQHLDGVRCTDILSRRNLPIRNRRIRLTIPAGALRIVDIEHR